MASIPPKAPSMPLFSQFPRFFRTEKLRLGIPVSLLVFVVGCSSVSGKYATKDGVWALSFESGGKVFVTNSLAGVTKQETYKTDGDRIMITASDGVTVLTKEKDDSLSGLPMEVLYKVQ